SRCFRSRGQFWLSRRAWARVSAANAVLDLPYLCRGIRLLLNCISHLKNSLAFCVDGFQHGFETILKHGIFKECLVRGVTIKTHGLETGFLGYLSHHQLAVG